VPLSPQITLWGFFTTGEWVGITSTIKTSQMPSKLPDQHQMQSSNDAAYMLPTCCLHNPIIDYMSLIILDNIIYYNKKYPLARQVFF
jgi:hypothetical protein